MPKLSKKRRAIAELVDRTKAYPIDEAIAILKKCPAPKFNQTVEVAVQLGVDARKSDQTVRRAVVLPNGTGKTVRVAVFAQGDKAAAAKAAGADVVGFEDLAEEVKQGKMDFDVVIASPDAMMVVGKLGQVLGPRGLMPNPKVGTVTPDVASAVQQAKAGQVRYRTDKTGVVHAGIGKVDFAEKAIRENLEAFVVDLKKAKPSSAKGVYLKKVTLSTTMGPGLALDLTSLNI
ncbi:MAG: 50S ribosomal protein L1 [Gammaproteobacteria bacterium RIFCSPHIGHO2_12_FULL_41_15]|nr:MAG: 50S ribosomal protein L1 [Gammaproteobacteria bacterium RIFCSPHIGHO2_12_FULL_41_15]